LYLAVRNLDDYRRPNVGIRSFGWKQLLGGELAAVAGEQRGRGGKISADQARALCGRCGR
jgi:hypothetical protein